MIPVRQAESPSIIGKVEPAGRGDVGKSTVPQVEEATVALMPAERFALPDVLIQPVLIPHKQAVSTCVIVPLYG